MLHICARLNYDNEGFRVAKKGSARPSQPQTFRSALASQVHMRGFLTQRNLVQPRPSRPELLSVRVRWPPTKLPQQQRSVGSKPPYICNSCGVLLKNIHIYCTQQLQSAGSKPPYIHNIAECCEPTSVYTQWATGTISVSMCELTESQTLLNTFSHFKHLARTY